MDQHRDFGRSSRGSVPTPAEPAKKPPMTQNKDRQYLAKPSTEAEKITHTVNDTIEVTIKRVQAWKNPPFQRDLRMNDRVRALIEPIRNTGVLPGVITLGVLDGDTYLVDGQHRREAFILADIPIGYCDIRVRHFKTMGEMAKEFDDLNARLVNPRPDDRLKAHESWNAQLQKIRKACPYVGYSMIRRNTSSPILSMSNLIRMWWASSREVPVASGGSAVDMLADMTPETTAEVIDFITLAYEAWGKDSEYARLWSSLNLLMCMWLYRRVVHGYAIGINSRVTRMDRTMFKKGLMALSADGQYCEWLVGRQVSERDRSPCYARVKKIISDRIKLETETKPLLPSPTWAVGHV